MDVHRHEMSRRCQQHMRCPRRGTGSPVTVFPPLSLWKPERKKWQASRLPPHCRRPWHGSFDDARCRGRSIAAAGLFGLPQLLHRHEAFLAALGQHRRPGVANDAHDLDLVAFAQNGLDIRRQVPSSASSIALFHQRSFPVPLRPPDRGAFVAGQCRSDQARRFRHAFIDEEGEQIINDALELLFGKGLDSRNCRIDGANLHLPHLPPQLGRDAAGDQRFLDDTDGIAVNDGGDPPGWAVAVWSWGLGTHSDALYHQSGTATKGHEWPAATRAGPGGRSGGTS